MDGDGWGTACDCSDSDPNTYPGASEVNDGEDNQCLGDDGFGLADEISGLAGFYNPDDRDEFSWPAQAGATRYRIARGDAGDFSVNCMTFPLTADTLLVDAESVAPGGVRYYLVRAWLPNSGSWGADSSGAERDVPCG